jgi:type IV pilus assembly protein PilC
MADSLLESSALSAFCGSVATMLSAGMQTDEVVLMLAENREDSHFKNVCDRVYHGLIAGEPLSASMASTKAFPRYTIDMVATGEQSGRIEDVLHNLDMYYSEEDRAFQKLRSSASYPATLLCIMVVILAITVAVILPVFTDVYKNMAGSLTAGSSGMVNASIIIGWASLAITVVCALATISLSLAARSQSGREKVLGLFEHLPSTKSAMYQLALSRFTAALSTYIASGTNTEIALARALETVQHKKLKERLTRAHESMMSVDNPRSLAQAITENAVFEPLYARMLTVGVRSGSTDDVLADLSRTFFDDSTIQIDRVIDHIEPLLAALLTIAVGATLISVMLPLIGIMGSIG